MPTASSLVPIHKRARRFSTFLILQMQVDLVIAVFVLDVVYLLRRDDVPRTCADPSPDQQRNLFAHCRGNADRVCDVSFAIDVMLPR